MRLATHENDVGCGAIPDQLLCGRALSGSNKCLRISRHAPVINADDNHVQHQSDQEDRNAENPPVQQQKCQEYKEAQDVDPWKQPAKQQFPLGCKNEQLNCERSYPEKQSLEVEVFDVTQSSAGNQTQAESTRENDKDKHGQPSPAGIASPTRNAFSAIIFTPQPISI